MPREQISQSQRRTITVATDSNGLKPGEWALGWAEPGDQLHEGQHWEDTPILYVGWHPRGDHTMPSGPGGEGCFQFHMEVDAEEVLRAADEIRRARENPALPGFPRWTFSTIHQPRHEAQNAVAMIRKARNAAFGGDE